jgi:hypothetical protein
MQRLKYKTQFCLFSTGVKHGLSLSPSFAKTALSTYGSRAGAAHPLGYQGCGSPTHEKIIKLIIRKKFSLGNTYILYKNVNDIIFN